MKLESKKTAFDYVLLAGFCLLLIITVYQIGRASCRERVWYLV